MFQQFCTVCVLYCVFGVCVCECVFKKDKDREVRNKGLKKRRLRHTCHPKQCIYFVVIGEVRQGLNGSEYWDYIQQVARKRRRKRCPCCSVSAGYVSINSSNCLLIRQPHYLHKLSTFCCVLIPESFRPLVVTKCNMQLSIPVQAAKFCTNQKKLLYF